MVVGVAWTNWFVRVLPWRLDVMTKKEFINLISNGHEDVIGYFLKLLGDNGIDYCVIGGLGVNAYVEPVVSLDLDIVIVAGAIEKLLMKAGKFFKIEHFPHSINLNTTKSDLRIQVQSDMRYQEFISSSVIMDVMGYDMKVATIENIITGKIWAYMDKERRKSKRQKDLADIFRIIEKYPGLKKLVPDSMEHLDF